METTEKRRLLGILGGLGPAASVYFYSVITEHTKAMSDQDHLDIVLVSAASIPDRTEFIIGKSEKSPLPSMIDSVKRLVSAGADLIAIPCNTAHYFFDQIEKSSPVPVLNIVRETVSLAKKAGVRKLGILATTGTVITGAYQHACLEEGLSFAVVRVLHHCLVPFLVFCPCCAGETLSLSTPHIIANSFWLA